MMMQAETSDDWAVFGELNARRRAIRHFDGSALSEQDISALVQQAALAPGSGNMQSYQFHWVRSPDKRALLVAACGNQRAAQSASALLAVVAHRDVGLHALGALEQHVSLLDASSQRHHRALVRKFRLVLRFTPWLLWAPVHALLSTLFPALTLLPIGPGASRQWHARNSIFAVQTLLLAASARGLDSCPMEGFDARRVAKLLALARGSVVPVVIALGRRTPDARVEARWRKPLSDTLIIH